MNKAKTGPKLRAERNQQGKTLQQVADETGLGLTTISYMERGFNSVADDKYIQYAEALGIGEKLFDIVSETVRKERLIEKRLFEIESIVSANSVEAMRFLNETTQGLNLEEFPSLTPIVFYLKGRSYFDQDKFQKAESYFLESIDQLESMDDKWGNSNIQAICYNYLGMILYYRKNNFAKALELSLKGIDLFLLSGERIDRYYSLLLNKAIYLEKMKLNEKALRSLKDLHHEVIKSRVENESTVHIRVSVILQMYSTFGTVLNNLGLYEEALEYTKKGLEIAEINRSFEYLFTLWTNMGIIYYSLGSSDEAETFYRLALSIEKRVKSKNALSFAYTNLSSLLIRQNKLKHAEEYMLKALNISEQDKNKLRQTEAYTVIGKWYFKQKKYQEALVPFLKAQTLANQQKFLHEESTLLTDICTCYEGLGDSEKYFIYVKKLHSLRKQIQSEED